MSEVDILYLLLVLVIGLFGLCVTALATQIARLKNDMNYLERRHKIDQDYNEDLFKLVWRAIGIRRSTDDEEAK